MHPIGAKTVRRVSLPRIIRPILASSTTATDGLRKPKAKFLELADAALMHPKCRMCRPRVICAISFSAVFALNVHFRLHLVSQASQPSQASQLSHHLSWCPMGQALGGVPWDSAGLHPLRTGIYRLPLAWISNSDIQPRAPQPRARREIDSI